MSDIVGKIIEYETGTMTEEAEVEFFQELLDTGTIHHLQGSYQRMAQTLLDAGLIHPIADAEAELWLATHGA